MKKTILIATLILFFGMGFTVSASAQEYSCSDLTWSAERLAKNANIANVCLEVVERNGEQYAKLHAKIVRQGVNSTVVQYQHPDGSWSASERVFPEGFDALIGGESAAGYRSRLVFSSGVRRRWLHHCRWRSRDSTCEQSRRRAAITRMVVVEGRKRGTFQPGSGRAYTIRGRKQDCSCEPGRSSGSRLLSRRCRKPDGTSALRQNSVSPN